MRKPSFAARPEVEGLDRREMLSGIPAVPTLTMNRIGEVARSLRNLMGTVARTDDFGAADRRLPGLAAGIPFGRRDLAAAWRGSLVSAAHGVPGAGLAARDQMLRDLYQDVYARARGGEVRVVGAGSEAFKRGPLTDFASYNRVELVNLTGRPIAATTYLTSSRSGQRLDIGPRVIRPEAGDNFFVFNFGPQSPQAKSISLEINATSTTQRFKEQPLAEPYGGAVFYVTTLGNYFVVSRQPPATAS